MAELTYDDAAHLLRRMGFGGGPSEVDDLVARGREGAVDYLINYDRIDNRLLDDVLSRSFDFSNPLNLQLFNPDEIRRWWFTRMVHTSRQFEEKMTLFWHNYFATANSKVPELFMYIQNLTLRRNALARFDDLLLKVAQDPAMLIWLDGITNVRGNPNENFARELQELFSMGVFDAVTGQPNYSENDVKEIARAFTGWKVFLPRGSTDLFDFRFFVNPDEHDNGAKTIYGQTANYSGEDVTSIIAARAATGRFLVKKLFEFFVYPLTTSQQDKNTIEKFAAVYASSSHSIKELIRAIFSSDEFFGQRARFGLVKSPIELIVGAIRMIGARYNPDPYQSRQRSNLLSIISALMGQDAFNPPDVAGWPLNLGWINTGALLMRYTYADFVAISRPQNADLPGLWLEHDRLRRFTKASPKKTVKKFLSLLGPLTVTGETMSALIDYLTTGDRGEPVPFLPDDLTVDKKVRGLVHQIMCLPEFQMA